MRYKYFQSLVAFIFLSFASLYIVAYGIIEEHEIWNEVSYEGNDAYISPTPGEIPIVAAYPCVVNNRPSLEEFRGVCECGFNVAVFNGSKAAIDTVCIMADKYDIKLMLSNEALRKKECRDFVRRYKDNKTIIGWYLKDEPKFETLDSIKYYYDIIKSEVPNKLIRVTLVGGLYPVFTGTSPDYVSYLDTIQKIFMPALWSYDCYPIRVKNGNIVVQYDEFYSDLEYYAAISRKTQRPFWAYCQSMAFKNKHVERPAATIPYLRFEAFSALAYGAQGIVYWTYTQRQSKTEQFLSALINLDGKKSPAWYYAKQVNAEIRLFSDIFLNSKLIDCRHSGETEYKNTKQIQGDFGPFETIQNEKSGFLFSHLQNQGKDYIVIVNHDVLNNQNINLTLKKGNKVKLMFPIQGKEGLHISAKNINKNFNTIIEPGSYLIFEWNNKLSYR